MIKKNKKKLHKLKIKKKNNICEECNKEENSTINNLILTGFKLCASCRISKIIFPV